MTRRGLNLTAANGLYLIAMALVISLGGWLQSLSLSWGLIATEVVCILLPTLIILRRTGTPLAAGGQISVPNWKLTLVSMMIGVGSWFVGRLIDAATSQFFTDPAMFSTTWLPQTPGQALVLFIGMAVLAPLCEEALFRGVLQPAYERHGALVGVAAPSLLFAFFHLRLLGLPALLPVAFFLGFTYYRTRSLGAAMVLHFGNNLLAVMLMIGAGLFPERLPQVDGQTAVAFGLIMTLTGLILLTRLTTRPAIERQPQPVKVWAWLALLAAAGIYVAGVTLSGEGRAAIETLFPNRSPLSLQAPAQIPTGTYTYELRNRIDEPVGQMICTLGGADERIDLFCDTTVQAFELTVGNSYYASGDMHRTLTAVWDARSLALLAAQEQTDPGGGGWQAERREDSSLVLNVDASANAYPVPEGALLPAEVYFRLMNLPWESALGRYQAVFVWPSRWDAGQQASIVAQETLSIQILPAENLALPFGDVNAVPVKIGADLAAWYAPAEPHIPVKLQDAMYDYLLLAE